MYWHSMKPYNILNINTSQLFHLPTTIYKNETCKFIQNRSTLTHKASFVDIVRCKRTTKSIDISSQFYTRISKGWIKPPDCLCILFTFWQDKQHETYSVMPLIIHDHQNISVKSEYILSPLGWTKNFELWASSKIRSFILGSPIAKHHWPLNLNLHPHKQR